ncbi:tRNA (guanine-1-)-methyltransferase [Thiomonas arsenitoxydans]|uniref:tRNA (guanine-N(1)-)-methyltransferase n=1 Tax=Thiomonas arsenitoxydans (strain DSM 22701 / CIP 110005 / 3As) TaxID=426114 RepID=D6CPN8_THIA3|nr:tRNA (guanine-N(1)-)-methyltransferase (M1G-methyltransferase) (tRNA [GM37] methyltransferase) [Thiomonas arsenitoxydans]CQR26498.1 tRNA (guanine-1-)-methyltransferase [Thiomonas arsenitoxydans]CQR27183.1 tRNA (guanine-1-)-methyltransferase [Thiomonas arsenitoxydans]CQR31568.1 tRNA (guanine-1-)-methyltransferase [Thiomonas arsenitoxydans]CQR31598.1 tRNA (guanine-1-)-methyltransferase [Thiomonas arsenitoxydans]
MLRFDVISLFPAYFEPLKYHGVSRRAFDSGQLQLQCWNPRDFTTDAHRTIDDRPYGGGPGMVMLAEPLEQALDAIADDRRLASHPQAPVWLFSPTGRRIDQRLVENLAQSDGVTLLCARYEGVDQRLIDRRVDAEISLGDFVLSGGEIPALALLDAVCRLLPGVLGSADSAQQDSFSNGLLDCPHYTRPEHYQGHGVPEALLSGDHARIAQWRREQSLRLTLQRRPDLIAQMQAANQLSQKDLRFLAALGYNLQV